MRKIKDPYDVAIPRDKLPRKITGATYSVSIAGFSQTEKEFSDWFQMRAYVIDTLPTARLADSHLTCKTMFNGRVRLVQYIR